MREKNLSRRTFIKKGSLAGVGMGLAAGMASHPVTFSGSSVSVPAVLGGQPVRTKDWPEWPVWDSETDQELVISVFKSGKWTRGDVVAEFEKKWAETVGVKRCLAVVNGTNALIASLNQFDIGADDEVIINPYS